MKNKIFTLLFFCFLLSFGQNRKGQFQLQENSKSHTLYVCFASTVNSDDAIKEVLNKNSEFRTFVNVNNLSFVNDIGFNDKKLNEMMESSRKNQKAIQSIQKLKRIYKIQTPVEDNNHITQLAKSFESFPEIEYSSIVSNDPITPPFINNFATTTNLESQQTYFLDNPGINVNYAWSRGITGHNIKVRDVEYGFHKSHEMIVNQNATQFEPNVLPNSSLTNPNNNYYSFMDHGTAVMSIMGAAKDNIGISGSAYNASEYIGFLEWTTISYDRIAAVARSINASQAGDIILYEMQTGGKNDNFVPAEYNNVIWDLTKAATDSGIIIIAAAGNGNENLDDPFYAGYRARGNSGAIIVGAGTNTTEHSKLSFSTYGSRVDVQGWGYYVLAAGYGDFAKYEDNENRSYTMFSGTSSATPIVASAAILIQSYHLQNKGRYLTPFEMTNLLVSTGIPQGGDLATKIGPIPNVKNAIESLERITDGIALPLSKTLKIEVYPNPSSDYISVRDSENKTIDFEIFNINGHSVLKSKTSSEKKFNISHLPRGTYLINATHGNRRVIEKLIKQ